MSKKPKSTSNFFSFIQGPGEEGHGGPAGGGGGAGGGLRGGAGGQGGPGPGGGAKRR